MKLQGVIVLEQLWVKDLALIDDLELEFAPGLNLITGETGSGKSILLDALGFVLGARSSAELIRSKADLLRVSARFNPPKAWRQAWKTWFEQKGLPWDDEALWLKRELSRAGKGKAWINSEPASVGLLAELGDSLVDYHGQHEHQALLRVQEHRNLLDRYGALEGPLAAVRKAFEALQAKRRALEGPVGSLEERRKRLDFLLYQIHELEDLAPQAGQWEQVKDATHLQASLGKRAEALAAMAGALSGEDASAQSLLGDALAAGRRLVLWDARQGALVSRLEALLPEIQDLAAQVQGEAERLEMDPAELERLQKRLHAWESLARKHRCEPAALPAHFESLQMERQQLVLLLDDESSLKQALAQAEADYQAQALALRQARFKAAKALEKSLLKEMKELLGEQTSFVVRFGERAEPSLNGLDEVEFLFAANSGEAPKPLAKIASGGELSRVTLALKSVLSKIEGAPCLVFDEIDAGISGRVGALVGEKILSLAGHHQVLCISHLPQIACLPARHFKVSKTVMDGITRTQVALLDAAGRETELASLLDSGSPGASALAHARTLLENPR